MSDFTLAATPPQAFDVLTPMSKLAALQQANAQTGLIGQQTQAAQLQNQRQGAILDWYNNHGQSGNNALNNVRLGPPPPPSTLPGLPQPGGGPPIPANALAGLQPGASAGPSTQSVDLDDGGSVLASLPSVGDISRLALLDPAAAKTQLGLLGTVTSNRIANLTQMTSQASDQASWNKMLDSELSRGLISQANHDQFYGRFDLKDQVLRSFADAGAQLGYQKALLEQGLQQGPDGSLQVNPVSVQAKGAMAGAEAGAKVGPAIDQAYGVSQAELPAKQALQRTAPYDLAPGSTRVVPNQNGGAQTGADLLNPNKPIPVSTFTNQLGAGESGNNPNARNPNSSATGSMQFIDGTWKQLARQVLPQTKGMSDQQILALRSNPTASATVAAAYAQQNAGALQQAGVPVNASTLALAHRFGPGGVNTLLQAPADTPISKVFGANSLVMQQNPDLGTKTVRDVTAEAQSRFGLGPVAFGQGGGMTRAAFTGEAPNSSTAPVVSQTANGDTVVQSGVTPQLQEEAKTNATRMGGYKDDLLKDAQSATQQNAIIDQMKQERQGWTAGNWASVRMSAASHLDELGRLFGDKTNYKPDPSVGSYEAYNKNASQLAQSAARAVGGRTGAQELDMITRNLPSDKTSPQGFDQIANQFQGINDYRIAKSASAANASGDPNGFEANWNKITPTAFIVNRMSSADRQALVSNLAKTPEGNAFLDKLEGQLSYAKQHNLFQWAR